MTGSNMENTDSSRDGTRPEPASYEARSLPAQPPPFVHPPQLPSYAPSSSNPSSVEQNQFACIPDMFTSLHQVTAALREAGLESSNLILGIDFTKSNEWTGKYSFDYRSLHAIGPTPNPYEQAISIIGRTLSPFDDDNLIPCFGFGDATTHDRDVFGFYPDLRPCKGFEEALARYREITPLIKLAGPTSFGPVIAAAIGIVEESKGQYHVLVIIADGQVTEGAQKQDTIKAIVAASFYPLSIVLIGVGDGPWEAMEQFDDNIPQRKFDNFQFVNFTEIMSENKETSKKAAEFARAALMEIPFQYRATRKLLSIEKTSLLRRRPLPPPRAVIDHDNAERGISHVTNMEPRLESSALTEQLCTVCLTEPKNMAFQCGHMTCKDCGEKLSICPLCRKPIESRVRLFM